MSSKDLEFLPKYDPDTLYVSPAKEGAYVTLLSEDEEFIAEVEVATRTRIAISLFYINEKKDFGSLKITKIKWTAKCGWYEDGSVQVNRFQTAHLRDFSAIISTLDLQNTGKTRISLANIEVGSLRALIASSAGKEIIRGIAETPNLEVDIYAVGKKREALNSFRTLLESDTSEGDWQTFFEANPWIFGHGLNYIFLDKTSTKLETVTTGYEYGRFGKRVDGLLRTKAEVSQFVLIEIKKNSTDLLQSRHYRSGCWAVSDELSGAVTQIQKTAFDFARDRFRVRDKDGDGNDLPTEVYCVDPRSYLVVGNLSQLNGNDDQIACFELFRRNIRAPEIITFDELYHRAECIVENVSHALEAKSP